MPGASMWQWLAAILVVVEIKVIKIVCYGLHHLEVNLITQDPCKQISIKAKRKNKPCKHLSLT